MLAQRVYARYRKMFYDTSRKRTCGGKERTMNNSKPICDAMREIVDDAKKQAEELFRSTPNEKKQDALNPSYCEEYNGKFFVYRLDPNGQYILDMVCDTEEDAVNRVFELRTKR